jgi:outer membrane lipoprotein-sorting protein
VTSAHAPRHLKFRARAMFALVALMSGAVAAHAAGTPSEAVRLENALKSVNGVRVKFVQVRDVALTGESVEAAGVLAFRPPQRFRLAYSRPEAQELVIQGDSLWVVMPSENQAQRYPFRVNAPGSEVFLLFGGQHRSLTEVFNVTQEAWGSYPAALRLFPKHPEPGYPLEEIRLVVGKNGFPERLFFREATGDNVVFQFKDLEKNPRDLDKDLALRLPKGIEIIDASPPKTQTGLPIDKQ